MVSTIVRFRNVPCPHCGFRLNACNEMHGEPLVPTVGDVGICIECALPHVFVRNGGLRRPDPDEMAELMADPDTILAMVTVAGFKNQV